ncbi:hypothetical protein BN13_150055 [Nostocoides jenkinsii Ben 74]|uniref:Uncharacterized protein n=1 Tax=Nostocoides jenkinsii Ben 74 TaxID=1193518 RepID=A0A077M6G8_9MICO|nr:hypothetical protein BN13_150055 [Tetrasphaera jenkinsii Ben 74]
MDDQRPHAGELLPQQGAPADRQRAPGRSRARRRLRRAGARPRRRPLGPGRRGPPRGGAFAERRRRRTQPPGVEEGRLPDPGRPCSGAQEGWSEEGPQGASVQQALIAGRPRPDPRPQRGIRPDGCRASASAGQRHPGPLTLRRRESVLSAATRWPDELARRVGPDEWAAVVGLAPGRTTMREADRSLARPQPHFLEGPECLDSSAPTACADSRTRRSPPNWRSVCRSRRRRFSANRRGR